MIPFLNLKAINEVHAKEITEAMTRVLHSGWYILGEEVKKFEEEFATYCKVPFCLGVGNGLDALILLLRSYIELGRLRSGDEILVPSNTYIASIQAITKRA